MLSSAACALDFNKIEFPAALFAVAPGFLNAVTVFLFDVGVGVGFGAPPRLERRL
jgi:hypothetical protein